MLADGNPAVLVPELYSRLTRHERAGVARFYRLRLNAEGRGDPRYPDDEPAEKIARRALMQGTWSVWFGLGGIFGLVGAAALSNLLYGGTGATTLVVLVGAISAFTACMACWGLRVIQIRRYFTQRIEESSDGC